MLELNFHGARYCAGPCKNALPEPPYLVPWYHFFIPHDGGMCPERVVRSKSGEEVKLCNFRVCVQCQSTLNLQQESLSSLHNKHALVMHLVELDSVCCTEVEGQSPGRGPLCLSLIHI